VVPLDYNQESLRKGNSLKGGHAGRPSELCLIIRLVQEKSAVHKKKSTRSNRREDFQSEKKEKKGVSLPRQGREGVMGERGKKDAV